MRNRQTSNALHDARAVAKRAANDDLRGYPSEYREMSEMVRASVLGALPSVIESTVNEGRKLLRSQSGRVIQWAESGGEMTIVPGARG